MSISDSLILESVKFVSAVILLGVGWMFGYRIIAYWDIGKKRQELDISTTNEFHKLYGEFKEVSRLWRGFHFAGEQNPGQQKVVFPETTPFELLKRATAAEGGVETIIVKLSTERRLNDDDVQTLGLFRQAFQKLREAIRGQAHLGGTSGTTEYLLFNELASKTACIISSAKPRKAHRWSAASPSPDIILRNITSVTATDWKEEIVKVRRENGNANPNSAGLYFRAGAGAIIIDSKRRVLALERADNAGAWQLPQGGIEVSETPLEAAFREIKEETGIPHQYLKHLGSYPHPLAYELPEDKRSAKTGRGQVQHWFLFEFKGRDSLIDIKQGNEFRAWRWMSFSDLANSVVGFRKPIYQALAQHFQDFLAKPDNTG